LGVIRIVVTIGKIHACNRAELGRLALEAVAPRAPQVTVDCVKLHKFDIESVSACAGRRTFLT